MLELQRYIADGNDLEVEWLRWLGVRNNGRIIRFSAGVYLIARKVAKILLFTCEENNMGTGPRLGPDFFQRPTVALAALPHGNSYEEVIEVHHC
jgi:hypothetical protein